MGSKAEVVAEVVERENKEQGKLWPTAMACGNDGDRRQGRGIHGQKQNGGMEVILQVAAARQRR